MPGLPDIPIDVLLDVLLPCFDLHSLVSLGATSKSFHRLIFSEGDGETLWKNRLEIDLNFPTSSTARRTGWLTLYKRVLRPELYAWGAATNERLGVMRGDPAARKVIAGGIPEREFKEFVAVATANFARIAVRIHTQGAHAKIVDIAAGGWSSHALDTNGQVHACGQMDGGRWAPDDTPWSDPFKPLSGLQRAPVDFPAKIKRLDAGRAHVLALDSNQRVYEWRSFGRVAQIRDAGGRWARADAISAGWDVSAVLIKKRNATAEVFIHFSPPDVEIVRAASSTASFGSEGYEPQTVHFEFPVQSILLPPLTEQLQDESIDQIAAGDNFVVALTNHSRVFKIDISPIRQPRGIDTEGPLEGESRSAADRERLSAAFLSGERAWIYLPYFSEIAQIKKHPALVDRQVNATRITHITAHFQSFTAYAVDSVKEHGLVLFGDAESEEESRPQILPALQGIGVIKVCLGDYHKGALTSEGKLLTFGGYSSGALGHGHRNSRLGTPQQQGQNRPAPVQLGGLSMYDIANPQEVIFAPNRPDSKFVFNAAFSGWHSLALVVDLEARDDGDSDEEPAQPMPGSMPRPPANPTQGNHFTSGVFNPRFVRLGYAARGLRRPGLELTHPRGSRLPKLWRRLKMVYKKSKEVRFSWRTHVSGYSPRLNHAESAAQL
jgi:SCF-associated factor 1